ncbi:hypothetical protein L0F63_005976 [Massospora cicadina]|nr:hypothetical protein L0F63_005976 [Massospora cicadina]
MKKISIEETGQPEISEVDEKIDCTKGKSPKNALPNFGKVRGMHDLFGEEVLKHDRIISVATLVAKLHGFTKIETPVLERTGLFHQGLGEDSEVVVGKELYSFFDEKNQEDVALRPEGTAGVMRAIGLGELHWHLPQRLFYHGAFFRHERPQRGRFRQFHQFGVEQLGPDHALADVEMIAMGHSLLNRLEISGKLRVHTLGTSVERDQYVVQLKSFLEARRDKLSTLSQNRLSSNPLRILDSKLECDQAALEGAPELYDHLGPASRARFDQVVAGLKALNISFHVDSRLVRGLDYYQHTVWEFEVPGLLGKSQATVLAGGRYDGLLEKIIGRNEAAIPAIGWACGIERLAMLLHTPASSLGPVYIVPIPEPSQGKVDSGLIFQELAHNLRSSNIPTVLCFPTLSAQGATANVTKLVKKITHPHPVAPTPGFLIFIGSAELASGRVRVRNTQTREESEVPITNLSDHFAPIYSA